MISVQHNMLAENANRQLNVNTKKNAKTAEKLSSGYRINRAADDAAGLAISEKMRRQVRGLGQAADNIKDGIGYVQTAEGALNEAQDILQRINQLSVQAANGTNTVSDRAYINSEVQALKTELSRIFSTTSFNEQKIWEPKEITPIVGYTPRQAVTFNGVYSQSVDVTNANCGVLSMNGYTIDADYDGVKVLWTGYDGKSYESQRIDWNNLKENNYSFDIEPTDDNGNVLFTYNVAMSVQETATVDDIIACIDGAVMSSGSYVSMYARFENPANTNISIGASLSYTAAYVSHINSNNGYNFDQANDDFLEPNLNANNSNLTKFPSATQADDARTSNETWEFSFKMEGIGTVTAKPSYFSYYSYDGTDYRNLKTDDKGIWWDRYYYSDGTPYETYLTHGVDKTLAGVMSALTGTKTEFWANTDTTPGLLTNADGASDKGGHISLQFELRSDQQFAYGVNSSSDYVGSLTLGIPVDVNDSEQDVLDKITAALNANTITDLYNISADNDYSNAWRASVHLHNIELPVYGRSVLGGKQYFWVQAGAEAGQHIDIEYESLSLHALGMQDTDVLTAESAGRAIDEVKGALQVVSDQRSLFGAYQNRLEHAYNINKNVEENTQASESLIRDTDIADAMMEYSINNILLQAGTSMLTQANQSSQLITQLLG